MQPLTLDDLLPLAEYAGRRREFFAAHARYLDRYRRVRVGPKLTLVFENRQTLWFRVHEILRVARLSDPLRVQQELDWYNRLLPARGTLQAALLLADEGDFWQDFDGTNLRLHVGDVMTTATLTTCRPEDRCSATAHWVTFPVGDEMSAGLADARQAAFIDVEYRGHRQRSAPLSEAARRSLLDDLPGSNRSRAA